MSVYENACGPLSEVFNADATGCAGVSPVLSVVSNQKTLREDICFLGIPRARRPRSQRHPYSFYIRAFILYFAYKVITLISNCSLFVQNILHTLAGLLSWLCPCVQVFYARTFKGGLVVRA